MKIDLHCHTKKCKKGDSKNREVNKAKFMEKVKQASVDIVGITNHNCFDYEQYNLFLNDDFQVWPGVEFDVIGNQSYGHCIIIVNPLQVEIFASETEKIFKDFKPDKFQFKIEKFVEFANKFDSIIICHYKGKKPCLSDIDIEYITNNIKDNPLFLEPSNLTSAGIYLAHDLDCMVGSDVKNWDTYEKNTFPELKIHVDSFENFKLLIKKDKEVIKTFVDKKQKKQIKLQPFDNCNDSLSFDIYNDITIIIGAKGTGKTQILKSLEKYFSLSNPNNISSYYGSDNSKKYENITSAKFEDDDFSSLNCENGSSEFDEIKKFQLPTIQTTNLYYSHRVNFNSKSKFGFCESIFNETLSLEDFNHENKIFVKNSNAVQTLLESPISKYLEDEELNSLKTLLEKMLYNQKDIVKKEFSYYYGLYLERYTIIKMKEIYQIKKGKPSRPENTGLLDMYNSCSNLYNMSSKLLKIINDTSKGKYIQIGDIDKKGHVFLRRSLSLDPKNKNYKTQKNITISSLRKIKKQLESIKANAFSINNSSKVTELIETMNETSISNLNDFLILKTDVVISKEPNTKNRNYQEYSPSNGEQAMLALNNTLYQNKAIYIMDEPELSVGHDYISNVIVPKIIELSKLNKTIIIATHDANIAVRTLPFTTIYRMENNNKKKTFIGNPFNDYMQNINNQTEQVNWRKICLDTLEGGEIAFKERGETYGKKRI